MLDNWDETRIDIIGRNGNSGCHYESTEYYPPREFKMSDGATEMMREEGMSYQEKVAAFTMETSTKGVIRDLIEREQFGLLKYGKYLTTRTDEDMLNHLYQELLDASCYIKTLINQRKEMKL